LDIQGSDFKISRYTHKSQKLRVNIFLCQQFILVYICAACFCFLYFSKWFIYHEYV